LGVDDYINLYDGWWRVYNVNTSDDGRLIIVDLEYKRDFKTQRTFVNNLEIKVKRKEK
jgi:hypothetical protein